VLGLQALTQLGAPARFTLCKADGCERSREEINGVTLVDSPAHTPADCPHAHSTFSIVGPGKSFWYNGYQDVIAIGTLFPTREALDVRRVISLAGFRW